MDYSQTSEELCPVCGDRVSGYHYGLLTCESCKGFFKRTVQNNKRYVCIESRRCRIDKAQRKRCPFCRFQKCLDVGMRLEAVRADRMRGGRNKFGPMYKWHRALRQQRRAQAPVSSHLGTYCTIGHTADSIPPPNITPQTNHHAVYSDSPHVTMAHVGFEDINETQKPKVPPLVFELLRCDPDEAQVQNKIQLCLQQHKPQWDKHSSLFSLMFSMAEHTLFSIVEWARTSVFFKQLEVSDQMTLLHNCWSELLLLDVVCREVLNGRQGHLLLITGHEVFEQQTYNCHFDPYNFDFSAIGCQTDPILSNLLKKGQGLIEKFLLLKMDRQEFVCMKFMIVFNPDGKQLTNRSFIERVQEQVRGALLEYALSSQCLGRFTQLLQCLSEIHFLSTLAEDYLWRKHQSGEVPCNNLLTEMLYAKRSNA